MYHGCPGFYDEYEYRFIILYLTRRDSTALRVITEVVEFSPAFDGTKNYKA